jgi:hypothetical protein
LKVKNDLMKKAIKNARDKAINVVKLLGMKIIGI